MASSVRDLTQKYREAVRAAAVANGYDEARLAKVMATLMLYTTSPRTTFYLTAEKIAASIRDLQSFIASHERNYAEKHRSTEQDRDSIENEVALFMKACRDSIDALTRSIGAEEKKEFGKKWLQSLGRGSSNADLIAHQHGMVLILSKRLQTIAEGFDELRKARYEEANAKKLQKRRMDLHLLPPHETVQVSATDNDGYSRDWLKEEKPQLLESRQLLMDQETEALQRELEETMAMAEDTERKMIEVSQLNSIFANYVLVQAKQIEQIYLQAMKATEFMEKGNKELAKTQQRNSSSRLYIILIFCVLTTTLLFLDWYNG
ncbi:hypothetical protein KC19_VG206500 [Ceratodon purpureus]|uniref:SNARE-complex protein Syntaxin-18 N-terminal domain-containing protein n=1 Tax=Ceratodon purpureus TaxID=3225 RepID=A0A8T0HSK4_CERPU|nr:hypothetical protein KC19_VG206500 [Ceratodon purpureus]